MNMIMGIFVVAFLVGCLVMARTERAREIEDLKKLHMSSGVDGGDV